MILQFAQLRIGPDNSIITTPPIVQADPGAQAEGIASSQPKKTPVTAPRKPENGRLEWKLDYIHLPRMKQCLKSVSQQRDAQVQVNQVQANLL